MKIEINITDDLIDAAFESPHSRYWCSELTWLKNQRVGTCVETESDNGEKKRITITEEMVKVAIEKMISEGREEIANVFAGETDGPDRDVFLQYVVFGEIKYG